MYDEMPDNGAGKHEVDLLGDINGRIAEVEKEEKKGA